MLKWRVENRGKGHKIKNEIREIADTLDFITLAEAKDIVNTETPIGGDFHKLPIDNDEVKIGWRWSDLKGNKLHIRTLKDGTTWLYITEPTLNIHVPEDDVVDKEKEELDYFMKALWELGVDLLELISVKNDGRRKCVVHKKSYKKNVEIEEYPCWFHCWFANRIVKPSGENVDDLLGVCEFPDGHVERIRFDHIRFVDEWEEK